MDISPLYYTCMNYDKASPFPILPCARWLEHIDSEPGLNRSMIEALIAKRNQDPEKYTQSVCNILHFYNFVEGVCHSIICFGLYFMKLVYDTTVY